MSSFRGAALALVTMVTLAGCGFQPVYGTRTGAPAHPDLAAIRVNPVPERLGQLLTISLRDSLNPRGATADNRYALDIGLTTQRQDLAIRKDETATRARLDVIANYVLRESASNQVVLRGSSRSTLGFDILDNEYATLVSEQDARERAIAELSHEIHTRLALFLQRRDVATAP